MQILGEAVVFVLLACGVYFVVTNITFKTKRRK